MKVGRFVKKIRDYFPPSFDDGKISSILSQFSDYNKSPHTSFYTNNLEKNVVFQGDIISNLPIVYLPGLKVAQSKVLILSNTCDIDTRNQRIYNHAASYIQYCPIIPIKNFRTILLSSGIEIHKIDTLIKSIQRQDVTSMFYLPSSDSLNIKESVALLGATVSYESEKLNRNELQSQRLGSLSLFGWYFLLFKVSQHFSRLTEPR